MVDAITRASLAFAAGGARGGGCRQEQYSTVAGTSACACQVYSRNVSIRVAVCLRSRRSRAALLNTFVLFRLNL